MVPSGAMGRDIPVAFLAGGPHAVYLLDPFDAGPDVSNWVTAGNAMNTLAGKGISVVAPAGGAYSMYTNWEQDGSKQWDTFLSSELPDWLAANKGLAPGGHAAVGASQGGYAAMALAAFHPDRFGFAGSLSGFLYPSNTTTNGSILAGLQQFGGVDGNGMWGPPQLGRWKWHDPYVHASLLAQNNTRVWVWSPTTMDASDPAAMIGQAGEAMGTSRHVLPAVPQQSAATTATSTSRAAATTAGARGRDNSVRCPAISSAPSVSSRGLRHAVPLAGRMVSPHRAGTV